MSDHADYVFLNGQVITADSCDRVADSVGVKENRISYVGDSFEARRLIGHRTIVVDLNGRSLLPGFIDAHCHAGMFGVAQARLQCGPEFVRSIQDIKRSIGRKARETPEGALIIGRGYLEQALEEKRHPNKWDLDEAAPNHQVIIVRTCGHFAVANSRVLEACGILANTPDPHGGRIDRNPNGEPTGLLIDEAASQILIKFQPSTEEYNAGIREMNRKFLSLGITSAHDASGRNPEEIRAFQRSIKGGALNVRLNFMVQSTGEAVQLGDLYLQSGMMTGFGDERLRLGPYKMMLDGAGSGGSAAMLEPYSADSKDYGVLYYDQDTLTKKIQKAREEGFQVAVHAIGDRAIEMVLESYGKTFTGHGDLRPRIEHCGFLNDKMIEKMRNIGVIAVLGQPFLYELGDAYINIYGSDKLRNIYPLNALLSAGVKVALSSDSPVINPNPMHGLYFAVTGRTKSGKRFPHHKAVGISQVIKAYTIGGAYASFEENHKGSIEIGKLADIVVLSRSLIDAVAEEILETKVDLTMVNGEVLHSRI
jgi:predicted amidohydrolase YtcJ